MTSLRSFFRARFTYANVVATLALFLAVSGAAYASNIGRNTIGDKQLRPDSVGTSEVQTNAVGALELKADSVGPSELQVAAVDVPELSAKVQQLIDSPKTPTGVATGALTGTYPSPTLTKPVWTNLIPAADAGGAASVHFNTNWDNFSSVHMSVGFTKDSFGFVHLKGLAWASSNSASTAMFTLPAGYRPGKPLWAAAYIQNSPAPPDSPAVTIGTDGVVSVVGGAHYSTTVDIDSITFAADVT